MAELIDRLSDEDVAALQTIIELLDDNNI